MASQRWPGNEHVHGASVRHPGKDEPSWIDRSTPLASASALLGSAAVEPALVVTDPRACGIARPTVPLGAEPLVVGRGEDCGLRLLVQSLSRRHATVERRAGEFVVVDHGSSNGVFVNGERVSGERPLRHGDIICLGPVVELRLVDMASNLAGYPYPIAAAMLLARAARSPIGRARSLVATAELALRYLVAAQLAMLGHQGDAEVDAVAKTLRNEHGVGRDLSTGTWLSLARGLARLCVGQDPVARASGSLLDPRQKPSSLALELVKLVEERNRMAHVALPENEGSETEAACLAITVEALLSALSPLLALPMVADPQRVEYIDADTCSSELAVLRGPSGVFPVETRRTRGPVKGGGWCSLLLPSGEPLLLAPFWGHARPPGASRLEVVAARALTLGPAGTRVVMERLDGRRDEIDLALPPLPWLLALGRQLPSDARR